MRIADRRKYSTVIIYVGHATKEGVWLFESGDEFPYDELLKCLTLFRKPAALF